MWVPTPALHSPGFTCSPWELPPCCSRGATAVILSANKQHVKLYKPLGLATGSTVRIDRASKRQTDRHKPGEHSYGSSEDSYLFVKVNCIFEARHFLLSLNIFHSCVLLLDKDALQRWEVIYAASCLLSSGAHGVPLKAPTPSQVRPGEPQHLF